MAGSGTSGAVVGGSAAVGGWNVVACRAMKVDQGIEEEENEALRERRRVCDGEGDGGGGTSSVVGSVA